MSPGSEYENSRSHRYFLNDQIPTCRQALVIRLGKPGAVVVTENKGMDRATAGQQRGTCFKPSLYCVLEDGRRLNVWCQGRVHPVDIAAGIRAH
jgi:hypothetical protein